MLAIHHLPGSFSDKWIEYCELNNIAYKVVDCYSSDIVSQIEKCVGLMWHWLHYDHRAALFARQLTCSLELSAKKVFPSFKTCWHFDDKVGQKYLLEAICAPLVPSYTFYNRQEALAWAETARFPKVFKLRCGASSENVRLVCDFETSKKLINRAFGKGFKIKNRVNFLKERLWRFRRDKTAVSFLNISKGIARLFVSKEAERCFPPEKNYVYFQDFMHENDHDIRVVVIGKRAFAIKRWVRSGDFRASGSGNIGYAPSEIPKACIRIAFDLSKQLGAQCLAYDFVFCEKEPKLVEVSYSFAREGYLPCPGFWNDELEWMEGHFVPEFFMIEDFLAECARG